MGFGKILAMIVWLRHLVGWVVSAFPSRQDLILENLALRQQLLALHAELSLFLEILDRVQPPDGDGRIGKDDVRILSRANFERRIEELKQDSEGREQGILIRGIYVLRQFCIEKKSNVLLVSEGLLQQNDRIHNLLYHFLDYRIIHTAGTALTHKSQPGTFHAFAIDIGCYAHMRKLEGRFNEIDLSGSDAKEKMRSGPILDEQAFGALWASAPKDSETALRSQDHDASV